MNQQTTSRKSLPLWVSTILFVLTYFIARGALEMDLPEAWHIVFALLPIPAFILFLLGFIRSIRELDELERRIHLEALAIAFPLIMIVLMTLGLLELAIKLPPEDLSYRHVWAMVPIFYFGGLAIARKRYL